MKIAYGNSRMEKKWKNREISWEEFCKKVSSPVVTTETVEEYRKMPKKQQDDIKDVGGFVGGHLKEGKRKSGTVLCRSMLTLDMDYGTEDVIEELEMLFDYQMCLYSTHKHTPEQPRLRLIIPLGREISEEEYPAVARMVAKEIGMDLFDDTTYQPQRLMYWPSVSMNGEFVFRKLEGDMLNPDDYLAMYDDWCDISTHPTSKRQSVAIKKDAKEQADPLGKSGIVGAFCRTYGIRDAIDTFLKEVYAPSAMEGRYDYIPADSSAGVTIHDEKFAYSFHATDPACGKLLNAFDVVRVHLFPDEDEKKSFHAMAEFACRDEKVKLLLLEEKQADAVTEFDDTDKDAWKAELEYNKRSTILANTVRNIMLILTNDEDYANFAFNEMAGRIQVTGPMPWQRPEENKFWRDADTAQLKVLLDLKYGVFSSRNHEVSFTKVADDRRFHPIRDYLNSLPAWDKIPRVDSLLIDYFGAEDNEYVRCVSRKTIVAAVARIICPGIKFDNVLILNGPQGIGKSTFYAKLAGEYFSDSLSLMDMKDKSGAEKLQGYWILELGEMAGMKKADVESVKSFISRTDDEYRPSYGKTVESHPRQCVIVGSTNSESGFLRDITGNRRFWPVRVTGKSKKKSWQMTQAEVAQIWAEALHLYNNGEKLYLEGKVAEMASAEQMEAMENDERQGLVEEYLNMLLPEGWDGMDIYARRNYVLDRNEPTAAKGVAERTIVSNAEIWCECFGRNIADLKPADSYAIAALMTKVAGWQRSDKIRKLPCYGRQRVYVKQ